MRKEMLITNGVDDERCMNIMNSVYLEDTLATVCYSVFKVRNQRKHVVYPFIEVKTQLKQIIVIALVPPSNLVLMRETNYPNLT
jgi:hypothetical protein